MAAARTGASEMLGDFIKVHVPMIDLEQELYRALQPRMQASNAG
jgi:hypothetical protein